MTLRFLQGGGAMGAMLRALVDSDSPLGSPTGWPAELRTVVSIMLGASQPMFLAWGEKQLMLYNDGYVEILGGHHPAALGKPFLEVWSEITEQVGPIMQRAYDGQSTHMDDIELHLQRHGRPEEAHFSFFYTPVRDETGSVLGVFCACNETTVQVAAARNRVEELERLREMFEQSPSFVAVLRGPEHRFELANLAFKQLTGQCELIGRTVRQALPELEEQGFFRLLDKVYKDNKPFKAEAMPLTVVTEGTSPTRRYLDYICQPLRDPTGRMTGIFIEGIDITASHEHARVLQESEEKFRTFAQAVPNHVWTAPADGQLDWFNEQTLNYSGSSMQALAGSGWTNLVHADDLEMASVGWEAALAQGSSYEIEFRIQRADGTYRWHLVRAMPIRDESGAVVRWVGTNTDIEQQRADREALLKLNVELERRVDERTRERDRIWRNSPDLMAVMRTDGVFTDVNPAWTSILGWTAGEVIGSRIDALVHPDDLANAEVALIRAGKGILPTFECRALHADGSYRIVAWTAAPEGDAIFAFGRDITPDMEQKKALALAEEQLRQSQKMEAIGQLTGGIAHDFNNMLASIYGSIQLLQRRLKSGKLEGLETLLERASTSTQRASSLTQRLLAFARRQSLDIRRVDVVKLIESLDDMFVRALGPKVELKIELASDLWSARIDAGQLENSLLNLVINARDAMPDGGRLTIEAGNVEIDAGYAASQAEVSAGEYVALRVTDDGAGMPTSVIARAFEPFFTTKPIGQGTGLGLSMVYGFVKQAGGHIRIHSEVGNGTTVSLFLPRDLTDGNDVEPAPNTSLTPHARTGETILVVEDEESVRAVIVAVLQDLGYRFIETADAKAALAVIDTGTHIDLLVSDVGLPGMNGRQLAEIATARRPGLKVLFVTGYAEQAAVRHGFLSSGMEMITKPFVIDELADKIRSILARGQSEAE